MDQTEAFRRRLASTARTSDDFTKLCTFGNELKTAATAAVSELTEQRDKVLLSAAASAQQIQYAEDRLAAAELDSIRLQINIAAIEKQIPALQAEETTAAAEMRVLLNEFKRDEAAYLASVRAEYDDLMGRAVGLLSAAQDIETRRVGLYRTWQNAPALARAAVPLTLEPIELFARGAAGANRVGSLCDVLPSVPALADPANPDSPRPYHWPPAAIVALSRPSEPSLAERCASQPSTGKSWTVVKESRNPPGPYARADDELPAASSSPRSA